MTNKKKLKKGLISVVMSNYNTPINYLKESIDSVLNQTYSNFEFIIIDDGSTDNSLEFIKTYDDPRIKLIINKENIGLTKSLNKGFETALGEYVARMDSDDICYPERFEKQLKYMIEHPDTIVCGAWADIIDANNNHFEKKWALGVIEDMDIYRIHLLFSNKPLIIHPSAFFNHETLLKNNIKYNENYAYAQDYDMWVQCSKHLNCYIYPQMLISFRQHKNSTTSSKFIMQNNCAIQIIQNQLKALHLSLSDDLKNYHYGLFYEQKPYNLKIKNWIRTIIKANKKYNKYNQKLLKHLLWYRWSEICYKELSKSNYIQRVKMLLSMPLICNINLFKLRKKKRKTLV